MPNKYDTLTSSESKDEPEERGGLSAQAVHGSPLRHVPIKEVVVMPEPPSEARQAIVRIPNLQEVTLFERNHETAEDEDDEDDDSEDNKKSRQRSRQPVSQQPVEQPDLPQPPVIPMPPTERLFRLPLEEADIQTATDQAHPETLSEEDPLEHSSASQLPSPSIESLPPIERYQSQVQTAETATYFDADDNQPQPIAGPLTSQTAPRPISTPSTPSRTEAFGASPEDTPPPPSSAAGTGGAQPPLPPYRPPATPDFNHYPSFNPNVGSGAGGGGYANYERPAAPPVSQRQEHKPQYDNNRAVDGFARLLAFGAGVGSFIGIRNTRKQLREHQRQTDTNFADLKAQQLRTAEHQRQQNQAMDRLRQERPVSPVPPFAAEQAPTYASQENVPAGSIRSDERRQALPPLPKIEARPGERSVPQHPEQQVSEEPLEVPEGHHLERSSWHVIEVDKQGREVQDARSRYGEEFRRSQREIMHDRTADASAAGTTALAGIQQQQGYGPIVQYPGTLPSGITPQSLPQGMPIHADPQHQLPAQTKSSSKPGPVFWVMLLVILAAFFAAAMI